MVALKTKIPLPLLGNTITLSKLARFLKSTRISTEFPNGNVVDVKKARQGYQRREDSNEKDNTKTNKEIKSRRINI